MAGDKVKVGTPFFTPGMIDAEINLVQSGLRTMLDIIQASEKVDEDFKTGFIAFCREWDEFRGSLNVVTKTFNQSWETVQAFKQRMYDWSEKAKKEGVKTYTTNPSPPPGSSWTSAIPWWVWAGLGGVILYNMHPLKTAHSIRSLMPSKKNKKK